tara:strand:- start:7701 stop:9956 length:2256 start_codon:yes stop_codon:yes gene_type:complete
MKILYISQSVIPSKSANSIHAMKMCSALSNLNNKVDLFCWNNNLDVEKNIEDFYKFYSVDKNFKILRLKVKNFWFLREIVSLIFLLYKIFSNNYDLIYSRSIQISWFLSILGIKTVLEIHSPPSIKTNYFFKKILIKGNLFFLVLVNNALKQYILKNYKKHIYLEIIVLPDAADDKKNLPLSKDFKRHYKIKKNSVGYLGHLYEGRGIQLIIKLAKEFPKNNFYIVGGAEQHVITWKRNLNLSNIFFLGFQNQNSCYYLRNKFDYLIAPYQNKVYVHGAVSENKDRKSKLETSKWMSPLKLFEYMQAKKPIITSDLPAINEILTNDEDAILCNPNNFVQWKKAIIKLNKDKAYKKRISTNAYTKFINKFTWKLRAKNILLNYKKLVNRKNITIFNFSLVGGGTEYMLSVLFNKLVLKNKHNLNMLICKNKGHYIRKIYDQKKLYSLNKNRIIFSISGLIKFLKENNSNVLFTSMTHTNVTAIIIKIFFLRKLKVIIRESNTISFKAKENLTIKSVILNQLVKILYNKADIIIAPTKIIRNDLIKNYNVKKDKISVIVNPYDFQDIYSKSNEHLDENEKKLLKEPFILSVGRLNPQKNYELLIKIFGFILKNKKFKNYKLYILGEGRDRDKISSLIDHLNLKKNVNLLGFKKNPFKFMKKCKLFILTSKYEGHSNVLVHSQILNNKILASKAHGANREVLSNNGEVFEKNDPYIIANQAIKIINNKKKKNEKKLLLNKFNDEIVADEYSKLF